MPKVAIQVEKKRGFVVRRLAQNPPGQAVGGATRRHCDSPSPQADQLIRGVRAIDGQRWSGLRRALGDRRPRKGSAPVRDLVQGVPLGVIAADPATPRPPRPGPDTFSGQEHLNCLPVSRRRGNRLVLGIEKRHFLLQNLRRRREPGRPQKERGPGRTADVDPLSVARLMRRTIKGRQLRFQYYLARRRAGEKGYAKVLGKA